MWNFALISSLFLSEINSVNCSNLFKDDTFSQHFYDSNWYALSLEHQKAIALLIQRKQNAPRIFFGPFGILNRNLFKMVSYHK